MEAVIIPVITMAEYVPPNNTPASNPTLVIAKVKNVLIPFPINIAKRSNYR
jgi:hypothetical protein